MMKTMMTMMCDEVKIEGEARGGFPIEEIEVIENEEEEDEDVDEDGVPATKRSLPSLPSSLPRFAELCARLTPLRRPLR